MIRIPTTQNESPYSLIYHKEPEYISLKPFGCAFYSFIKPYNQHKLQFHITICFFWAIATNTKGTNASNHMETYSPQDISS